MTHSQSYRRILHKMGYYDYQQGLIYRHLNQQNGWDSHLERCRKFILRAAGNIKPEKITVLGSGWLLELPLAELAERTGRVVLMDIIHPPEVKEQVKKLKNVELIEKDVSGGLINEVWLKAGRRTFLSKLPSLESIEIPEFNLSEPGMLISVNLLTQMESLPVKFLSVRSKAKEEEYTSFRKKIQESHIRFLQKHKSVLITDTKEVFFNKEGHTEDVPTLLADIPEGSYKEQWQWDFDLMSSDFNMKRSVFNVMAVIF